MCLVRWVSCPRLESHDHNSHIANLAAGANVGEKEEQGGGGGDRNPEWSLEERGRGSLSLIDGISKGEISRGQGESRGRGKGNQFRYLHRSGAQQQSPS